MEEEYEGTRSKGIFSENRVGFGVDYSSYRYPSKHGSFYPPHGYPLAPPPTGNPSYAYPHLQPGYPSPPPAQAYAAYPSYGYSYGGSYGQECETEYGHNKYGFKYGKHNQPHHVDYAYGHGHEHGHGHGYGHGHEEHQGYYHQHQELDFYEGYAPPSHGYGHHHRHGLLREVRDA